MSLMFKFHAGNAMGASASVDQVQIICSNVERAVPRTPRGSRDVEHCDRDGLTDVISRAEQDVKAFYEAAWESCVADDLLAATAALQADFSPELPPRCALPQGATVEALVALASCVYIAVPLQFRFSFHHYVVVVDSELAMGTISSYTRGMRLRRRRRPWACLRHFLPIYRWLKSDVGRIVTWTRASPGWGSLGIPGSPVS